MPQVYMNEAKAVHVLTSSLVVKFHGKCEIQAVYQNRLDRTIERAAGAVGDGICRIIAHGISVWERRERERESSAVSAVVTQCMSHMCTQRIVLPYPVVLSILRMETPSLFSSANNMSSVLFPPLIARRSPK